jgi:hypothetical protein
LRQLSLALTRLLYPKVWYPLWLFFPFNFSWFAKSKKIKPHSCHNVLAIHLIFRSLIGNS